VAEGDPNWRELAALIGGSPERARRLFPDDVLHRLAAAADADPRRFAALLGRLAGRERWRWAGALPEFGLAEAPVPFDFEGRGTGLPEPFLERSSTFSGLEEDVTDPRGDDSDAAELTDHARRVGVAFREALLPGLPDELVDVDRFFAWGSHSRSRRPLTTLDEVALQAAGEAAGSIGALGISPLSFAVGARAVARSLRRHRARWGLGSGEELLLSDEADEVAPRRLGWTMLTPNVALSAELDDSLGMALLAWLVRAAPQRPLIFDGFVVEGGGWPLRLIPHAFEPDVALQWGERARPAP
jgi:hypothetical protein